MARVLLYGGSFDPIHHGHLIVARYAAEALGVPRVVLLPSAAPPHKRGQRLAPAADRLAMCRAATADDPQFEVSDWELSQPGPNYTIRTVEHFRAAGGAGTEVCWLIGMDSLVELGTWHRAAELVDACTIVTVARPGSAPPPAEALAAHFAPEQVARLLANVLPSPAIDIAAREIRARVRSGRSIRYLVPEPVRAYIAAHGLYRAE